MKHYVIVRSDGLFHSGLGALSKGPCEWTRNKPYLHKTKAAAQALLREWRDVPKALREKEAEIYKNARVVRIDLNINLKKK